jgi:hypothetical protein
MIKYIFTTLLVLLFNLKLVIAGDKPNIVEDHVIENKSFTFNLQKVEMSEANANSENGIKQNQPKIDSFAIKINEEIIKPATRKNIIDGIEWGNRWRKISNYSEFGAKISFGLSGIFSFLAAADSDTPEKSKLFNIASGMSTLIGFTLYRISSYAIGESAERVHLANQHLERLGLNAMPIPENPSLQKNIEEDKNRADK